MHGRYFALHKRTPPQRRVPYTYHYYVVYTSLHSASHIRPRSRRRDSRARITWQTPDARSRARRSRSHPQPRPAAVGAIRRPRRPGRSSKAGEGSGMHDGSHTPARVGSERDRRERITARRRGRSISRTETCSPAVGFAFPLPRDPGRRAVMNFSWVFSGRVKNVFS